MPLVPVYPSGMITISQDMMPASQSQNFAPPPLPASRAPPCRGRSGGAILHPCRAAAPPYLSITAVMVPKCRRAPPYGLVTIGTTSYSFLMAAGIMSSNSAAFLTDIME